MNNCEACPPCCNFTYVPSSVTAGAVATATSIGVKTTAVAPLTDKVQVSELSEEVLHLGQGQGQEKEKERGAPKTLDSEPSSTRS